MTEGLDLSGKTYAITGANSGLGYETMRVLALRGAHVIGIARTQEKADKACASIDGEKPPRCSWTWPIGTRWWPVPTGSRPWEFHWVASITNAGIMALPELELINGVEKQFAINHLGHFILINQLQETVLAAEQGRFVIAEFHVPPARGERYRIRQPRWQQALRPVGRLRGFKTGQRTVLARDGTAYFPYQRHLQQRTPRRHPDQPGQTSARLAALVTAEIALGGGRRTNVHGVVSPANVERVAVRIRVDRHRLDAHLLGRAQDAHRDLRAVGDQQFHVRSQAPFRTRVVTRVTTAFVSEPGSVPTEGCCHASCRGSDHASGWSSPARGSSGPGSRTAR